MQITKLFTIRCWLGAAPAVCLAFVFVGCGGARSDGNIASQKSDHRQTVMAKPVRNPEIPPFDSLKAMSNVSFEALETKVDTLTFLPQYLYEGEPYQGWAYKEFPGDDHRHRFTKYQYGALVRQIGYYANGTLDHDFNIRDGRSYGSERMWQSDGSPYIDNYYSQPGVKDGLQRRWYDNQQLARESVYKDGELVYEIQFNREGTAIGRQGAIPAGRIEIQPADPVGQ